MFSNKSPLVVKHRSNGKGLLQVWGKSNQEWKNCPSNYSSILCKEWGSLLLFSLQFAFFFFPAKSKLQTESGLVWVSFFPSFPPPPQDRAGWSPLLTPAEWATNHHHHSFAAGPAPPLLCPLLNSPRRNGVVFLLGRDSWLKDSEWADFSSTKPKWKITAMEIINIPSLVAADNVI